MKKPSPPLRELLSPEWQKLIESLCDSDPEARHGVAPLLDWPSDSECGIEIIRIVARAEALASACEVSGFSEIAQNMREEACDSINGIAWG
jgi:hypothetical protein